MTKDKKLVVCGCLLVFCAVVPYLLLNAVAFPSQHMLNWVVSFSMMLNWLNYSFSLDAMVGWCYALSFIFSIVLFVLGILLCIKKCAPLYSKRIPNIIVAALLCSFYLFAAIVNITMAAQYDMNPTLAYYFYFFTEILCVGVLIFTFITIQKKNNVLKKYSQQDDDTAIH